MPRIGPLESGKSRGRYGGPPWADEEAQRRDGIVFVWSSVVSKSFLTQAEVDRLALPNDGKDRYLTQAQINALIEGDGEGVQSMKDWEEAIRETDGLELIPNARTKQAQALKEVDRHIGIARDNSAHHQTTVNIDKLRKAYEAAWVRHPHEWMSAPGYIDEVDGRFLALAFNAMHLLVAGVSSPVRPAPLSMPKAFHEGGRA